ncbi:MAG TPA: hypothetical protein VFV43_08245, partial [Limnobacter sp.]|nr:hypothetical protein [Limnobacter sp.]
AQAGAEGLVRASRKPALACRKGPVTPHRRGVAGAEPDRAVLSGRTQGIQAEPRDQQVFSEKQAPARPWASKVARLGSQVFLTTTLPIE